MKKQDKWWLNLIKDANYKIKGEGVYQFDSAFQSICGNQILQFAPIENERMYSRTEEELVKGCPHSFVGSVRLSVKYLKESDFTLIE